MTIDFHTKLNYLWLNGKFIKSDAAKIHLMTHSLHYSSSVFEGIRVYNGKAFKLTKHINRLLNSAKQLMISLNFSIQEIKEACLQLIKNNNLKNAYIRPLIWKGSESSKLASDLLSTNTMLAGWEITTPTQERPVNLCFSNWIKPHPKSMPPQCKSGGHYTMMIVSQIQAKDQGYSDAILLDWRGYIAECTTSNIFFVENNSIITPIADAFLNGITRQTVIEIAKKLDIIVQEKYINPDHIRNYQECFLTGTAMEIKAVKSIYYLKKNFTFHKTSISDKIKKSYNQMVLEFNE